MVGVHFEFSSGTTENRYFHKNHLGSVAALTDDSGNAVRQRGCAGQRSLSFGWRGRIEGNIWGKRFRRS